MVKSTGHAEIDQQHAILDSIIEEAGSYCIEAKKNPHASCETCASSVRPKCVAVLKASAKALRDFLVGHNTYEEKMMELLPTTQQCQRHVNEHKRAHAGIARELKGLTTLIAESNPKVAGNSLLKIAKDWLGNHATGLDQHLVQHLDNADPSEIDFDWELVAMLDQHVFHNRPNVAQSSSTKAKALLRRRMEIRGRFESLSRAQRRVFWLVVGGKTNSQIASELRISVNTVKTHRAAMFQKMETRTVLELLKLVDALR